MKQDETLDAVELTLSIVEELGERDAVGVTELADSLDRPKATVYYHLNTLRANHFVSKDDAGRYRLGFRFVEFAHHARNRVDALDTIREEVDALAEEVGEICLFSVPEYWFSVCLHVARGDQAVGVPLFVGRRHPLHATAVGKALLAHLPEERTAELIDARGLDQLTDATITDRDALLAELAEIRDRGVAYNRGETLPGLVGVGAPVVDHRDELVGAISIIGPERRIHETQLEEEFPRLLKQCVNVITLNLTESDS